MRMWSPTLQLQFVLPHWQHDLLVPHVWLPHERQEALGCDTVAIL